MKSIIIAGLMAVSAVAAIAAPAKTSKAVAMTETQMESVKGQGYLYVYVWNYNGSGNFYTTVINGQYLGQTSFYYQYVYSGGPQAGVYYW